MRGTIRIGTAGLLAAGALALASCGGGEGEGEPAAGGDTGTGAAGRVECREVEAPAPKRDVDLPKPKRARGASQRLVAVVETNCGDFEIALDAKRAPVTAGSFAHLVRRGLYDGTLIHRVAPGFVIQGGDPSGDGTGGPGYTVREPPPDTTVYRRGVVAMAKTGAEPPGSSGSQFFVVTAPADAGLPPEYAILGKVSKGIEVVEGIGRLGDPSTETPTETIVIERITLKKEA